MNVSLINSLLPVQGSPEEKEFNRIAQLARTNNPSKPSGEYQKSLQQAVRLGKLFNVVASETAEALLNNRYTSFDAIVKNFGCQITALQVEELVRDKDLLDEAVKVREVAKIQIDVCRKFLGTICLEGESNLDFKTFLCEKIKVDIEISPQMAQLICFRLLCIVNANEPSKNVAGLELPVTKVEILQRKEKQLQLKYLTTIVNSLQANESLRAAEYIRNISVRLFEENNPLRLGLSEEMVRKSDAKDKSPIVSLPLLYNTEVAIRGFAGTLLIKNKLKFCGKPILDAEPILLYLMMPEERLLDDKEIKALSAKDTLYVIEGNVNKKAELVDCIAKKQLIPLMNIQTARLNQYASGTIQGNLPGMLMKDIASLKELDNTDTIFNIDHMYCASVAEERDGVK